MIRQYHSSNQVKYTNIMYRAMELKMLDMILNASTRVQDAK